MKVAVIGSGPAGLTCVVALCRAHCGVDVYEASEATGGLARSVRLWNQTVDFGPHRFLSRNKRVNRFWLEIVGRDYAMVSRLTRVLYGSQFFHYPLRPAETLIKLGPLEAARCILSHTSERFHAKPGDGGFESWVCRRFGRRLFETFFKSYNEKLWGIPCAEVDADFAAQRIRQFSIGAAIKGALWRKKSLLHRTLVDQFAYPEGGTGMVYERMANQIEKRGGRIFLNTPVEAVITEHSHVTGIRLKDGAVCKYDHVVSTMPLTALVRCLPEAPQAVRAAARQLTFRSTILVYLEIADSNVFPDQWIYLHSPELQAGRVTNFRNWSPTLYGDSPNTILALEYWCNEGEGLWLWDDSKLVELAAQEIVSTGLVKQMNLIKNGEVYRIPKSYPVYRRGYKDLLKPIQEYLSGIKGLQVIGRYGAFKYNNQDHSILMGLLAADNILKNAGNDLWAVNSDYDNYQEGYRITETGLVREET
jgi:protoporphyrinogen oxidase